MVSDGIGNFKKGKVKNLFLTLTPSVIVIEPDLTLSISIKKIANTLHSRITNWLDNEETWLTRGKKMVKEGLYRS